MTEYMEGYSEDPPQLRSDPSEFSFDNQMTPLEAMHVPLPSIFHPFRRMSALAVYAEANGFPLEHSGLSPLPRIASRRDLVNVARAYEEAEQTMRLIRGIEDRAEQTPIDGVVIPQELLNPDQLR